MNPGDTRSADPWLSPIRVVNHHVEAGLRRHGHRLTGRLLDLGCGGKPWAGLLPSAVTRHVGVDFAPARQHIRETLDVAADVEVLPFRDAAFDAILCTQVIEHVPHPARLVAEAARVLRPGGVLLLTAPQTWCLHQEPHDYFRYTRHGLAVLAREAGFRVESMESHGGVVSVFAQVVAYSLEAVFGRVPVVRLLSRLLGALVQGVALGIEALLGPRLSQDTLGWTVVARKGDLR